MEGGGINYNKQNPTGKSGKEPIKVKYISSPVLVNAKNASEFRSIVQELTGKDPPQDDGGRRKVEQPKPLGGAGESSGARTPPSFEMNDKDDGDDYIFSFWGRSFKGFDSSS
nr:hypothetical protein BC332_12740 [Ipomoea trifida]